MRYFSMFSGIGGFEKAIDNATKGDCIGYSEINKAAESIYRFHYGKHKNYGDATKINPNELEDFDLLVGGFPCQAFSTAGKLKGFNESRGTLFFDIARICKDKRPRYILLENVKGLLCHDSGETFKTILKVLSDVGYDVQWQVLNSKNFGVPQSRERIFILGYLRGTSSRQIFPIGDEFECSNEQKKIWRCNTSEEAKNSFHLDGTRHTGNSIKVAVKHKFQKSVYDITGLCPTVREGHGDVVRIEDKNNRFRKITPKECERLMGFPDDWTKFGIVDDKVKEVSDNQRYERLGNAIAVPCVTAIIERMNI